MFLLKAAMALRESFRLARFLATEASSSQKYTKRLAHPGRQADKCAVQNDMSAVLVRGRIATLVLSPACLKALRRWRKRRGAIHARAIGS
jgi:hypothetical protein